MDKKPWLKEIPSTEEILNNAMHNLIREVDFQRKIKEQKISLSKATIQLEKKCYGLYLQYEKSVRKKYEKLVDPAILEKSLSQSRMARGGLTTEKIIHRMISILGVPCERNVKYPDKYGETLDLVVPGKRTLESDPSRTIIISVKRKVRERWRQVVGEAYILREVHGILSNIWFVTITCNVSKYIVRSMTTLGIKVYVPDKCVKEYETYGANPLSNMFKDLATFLNNTD